MTDRRLWLLAAVTACLVGPRPAAAQQLSFSFFQGGVPVEAITATQGSPASVQVFLVSVADPRFDTRDLFAVGTRVTTTGGFTAFDAIAPNTVANGGPFNNSQANATTGQLQVLGDGAAPVPFAATDQIALGTFTFTPTATGTFTLSAGDFGPGTQSVATNVNFGDAVVLDPTILGDALTVLVVPVPEPAGLLAAAAAVAGVWRARRRSAV